MEQEVVVSQNTNIQRAVDELCGRLKRRPSEYNAVIFMAAITYDFEELSREIKSRFPDTEVIGTSTAGEISPHGFLNDTVALTFCFCWILIHLLDRFRYDSCFISLRRSDRSSFIFLIKLQLRNFHETL